MKKLFKSEQKNLVDQSDPYWNDVYAVFNMDNSLTAYRGINTAKFSLVPRYNTAFVTINGKSFIDTSGSNVYKAAVPNPGINMDFTFEGWLIINSPLTSKYILNCKGLFISTNNYPVQLISGLPSSTSVVANSAWLPVYNNPALPVGVLINYAVVRKNDVIRYYFNGQKCSNDVYSPGQLDFSNIYFGGYDQSDVYAPQSISCYFGPHRLTRRARYTENSYDYASNFTYPIHG